MSEADNDPDYSPAYQDEYQRLWHQSAGDAERLRNLSGLLLQLLTKRGLGRFFPDELPVMDALAQAVRDKPAAGDSRLGGEAGKEKP